MVVQLTDQSCCKLSYRDLPMDQLVPACPAHSVRRFFASPRLLYLINLNPFWIFLYFFRTIRTMDRRPKTINLISLQITLIRPISFY